MIVFDLKRSDGSFERVGAIGSCRLISPVREIIQAQRARVVWHTYGGYTHSAAEAAQLLAFFRGRLEVPLYFAPYIFDRDQPPTSDEISRSSIETCQTLMVEISTLEDLYCEDYVFNNLGLAKRLVRGKGPTLLRWLRSLSASPPDAEALRQITRSLSRESVDLSGPLARILSGTTRCSADTLALAESMDQIVFDASKRWVFVSHFDVSQEHIEQHTRRTALKEMLFAEAGKRGHEVFDPTSVIELAGVMSALGGQGADPHHYAESFVPVMGQAIYQAIFGSRWTHLPSVDERLSNNAKRRRSGAGPEPRPEAPVTGPPPLARTREFKRNVITRLEAGESANALALELGVKTTAIHRWRESVRAGGGSASRDRGARNAAEDTGAAVAARRKAHEG